MDVKGLFQYNYVEKRSYSYNKTLPFLTGRVYPNPIYAGHPFMLYTLTLLNFLFQITSTQWLHTKALDSTCSPESGVLDQPELTPVQQCTNALLYHLCKYVMVPSGHKKFVKMDT